MKPAAESLERACDPVRACTAGAPSTAVALGRGDA
jgi:hypothetical protein